MGGAAGGAGSFCRIDFEFSAFQEEMRATLRRFLAEQAPLTYLRSLLDVPAVQKDSVWEGLCSLGAVGLLAPERLGGGGLDMVDMGVVLEEAGRALYPGPLLSSGLGALSLAAYLGAEDLVSALASGDEVGTLALLEPGAGYRWDRPATVASADGRLTGEKLQVLDGASAGFFLVVARAPDSSLAVYQVDANASAVEVEPTPTVDGSRKMATIRLDGSPGRRLDNSSAAQSARAALAATIDRLLVGQSVDGVGAAGRVLELAVDYAKVRHQFDRPIGSFQAVQHLCADMLRSVELARAGAYYALWAATSEDPAERHRAATMAKAYASEWLPGVGAGAIQVFGGIGFTWEHDAHLYYKRLLTLQQTLGGPSYHLEELAHLILD